MARELTAAEEIFIKDHSHWDDNALAEALGEGIGPKTVAKYKEKFVELERVDPDESHEDRQQRIANLRLKAGDFVMTHGNTKDCPEGVTIMTPTAVQIAESNRPTIRRISKENAQKANRHTIHRPKKK